MVSDIFDVNLSNRSWFAVGFELKKVVDAAFEEVDLYFYASMTAFCHLIEGSATLNYDDVRNDHHDLL